MPAGGIAGLPLEISGYAYQIAKAGEIAIERAESRLQWKIDLARLHAELYRALGLQNARVIAFGDIHLMPLRRTFGSMCILRFLGRSRSGILRATTGDVRY